VPIEEREYDKVEKKVFKLRKKLTLEGQVIRLIM
jgi:hypothetical protein